MAKSIFTRWGAALLVLAAMAAVSPVRAQQPAEAPYPVEVLEKLRDPAFQQRMVQVINTMRLGQGRFSIDMIRQEGLPGLIVLLDHLFPETAYAYDVPIDDPQIAQLVRQMGSPVYQKREAAYRELLKRGPGIAGVLREATRDSDPEIAWRAKLILDHWAGEDSPINKQFFSQILQLIQQTRGEAEQSELIRRARVLDQAGDLDSLRLSFVMTTVQAVLVAGNDELIDRLEPFLESRNENVRVTVARQAIMSVSDTRVSPLFLAALQSDDPNVFKMAAQGVRPFSNDELRREVEAVLRRQFASNHDQIRADAAGALWRGYEDDKALSFLLERIEQGDRAEKLNTLSLLAQRSRENGFPEPPQQIVESVAPLVGDEDQIVRRMTVSILLQYRGREILGAVVPLLADEDRSLAEYVRQQLSRSHQRPDVEILRGLLEAAMKEHAADPTASATPQEANAGAEIRARIEAVLRSLPKPSRPSGTDTTETT